MADAYVTLVAVQPTVAVRSGARQQQARKPQASLGASGGVFETLRNRQILRGQRGAGSTGEVVVNRAPTPPRDVVFTSPAPRELHLAVRLADGSDDIVLYRSTTPVFNRATWARQVIPGYTGNSALLVPDPPPPGTYYYAVATQNEHGESPISGIAKAVIHDFPLRAPRCPLTRQAGLLGAQAWWEEVEGATGYAVYAAGVPNAPLTASVRIVVPRPPYMVLRTGTNYIRIAAIGPEGEGLLTPEQQFRITALTPTGFGASVVAEGIRLSWAIPATTNAVQQYFVYRALTPDGPFEIIATPATNTYTDQTADFDLPYFYKVSAVDTVDGEGIATSAVNITRVPVPVSSPLAHVYPRRVDGAYAYGEPYMERAFTLAATGTVEVDYFTQGYNGWDGIRISVDGVSKFTNWTNVGAFGMVRVALTAGTRTVRIAHARRAGAPAGLDMTVVKAVRIYEGTTLVYQRDFTRGAVGALPDGWLTGAGNLAWQMYAAPAVPTPTGVTATLTEDFIDVSWAAATPPSGFHEGYTIWRAQANEPWVKVAKVANGTLTWRDPRVPIGVTYFYAVSLNDGVYGAGPQSTAILSVAHVAGAEAAAPYGFLGFGAAAGVVLSWRAPATPTPPVEAYNVYRADAADGPYTLLANVAGNLLTYTDATAVLGVTYYYRIAAVDSLTGEGAMASSGAVLYTDPLSQIPKTGLIAALDSTVGLTDAAWTDAQTPATTRVAAPTATRLAVVDGVPVYRSDGTTVQMIAGVNPGSTYTIVVIDRYNSQGGNLRARNLTSGIGAPENWLLGRWGTKWPCHFSGGWITSDPALLADANDSWHMTAAVSNAGASKRCYANNVDVTVATSGTVNPTSLGLGGWADANECSNADTGVVLVYNRVLSAAELTTIYNAYKGRFALP